MVTSVTFGSQDAARKIRDNPQYQAFLSDEDDGRQLTVKLKEGTPQSALDDITGEAADSKRHRADKAGQVSLTREERKEIDFSRSGVNVPKVRSIKAIAANEGVTDYLSFADLELTVDENRQLLKAATAEEQGRRGMGRDEMSDERIDQRLAQAHGETQRGQLDRAKQFALVETDVEAQEFVSGESFDIEFTRTDDDRLRGQGDDYDRLEERHDNRSDRAKTMDEKRSATPTRDPVQWSNNPNQYDYPGIDTVQPHELHEQRSERAQEADEQELAPPADTKEQWARNPDQYDWPGVDTPPAMGLGPNQERPDANQDSKPRQRPAFAASPEAAAGSSLQESFEMEMTGRDIPASPEEITRGVGGGSTLDGPGGPVFNALREEVVETDRLDMEQEPPEEALRRQQEGQSSSQAFGMGFTDDRDTGSQLTDFGMETDATQHRESREAEEAATVFGIDDRSDASRGAGNDADSGEQQGFEAFGGGVRENETLF